ncbi:MAG: hypothetical protein AMJ56_19270 [Anaerolineae bacterium SG8_19]|nr:MAG: hypothetical protein AMJ56_19270 [Anaerolineae bacterium SG8_19]
MKRAGLPALFDSDRRLTGIGLHIYNFMKGNKKDQSFSTDPLFCDERSNARQGPTRPRPNYKDQFTHARRHSLKGAALGVGHHAVVRFGFEFKGDLMIRLYPLTVKEQNFQMYGYADATRHDAVIDGKIIFNFVQLCQRKHQQ